MRLSLRIAALAAMSLMIAAAPAAAQTPQSEVSVGYQALHVPDLWFPAGFAIDGAYNLTDQVGVVGEFGWSRKSASADAGIATAEGSLNAYTFAGGVRVSGRGYAPVTPFAQVLVGGLHASGSASISAGGVTVGASDSTTEFMVQPGAGVVVPVGTNVGVVGQIDYRRVFFKNAGENEYRIFAGIRLGM
jgi:hypothetical protein